MTIRKIHENKDGELFIHIPAKFCREFGIKENDCVNLSKVGNSIHINKVQVE